MPSRIRLAVGVAAALALCAGALLLHARSTAEPSAAHAGRALDVGSDHDAASWGDSLGATARAQLAAARRATAALATPEAARAAGYRPMFGNVPLQGEHYVRLDLVLGDTFNVEQPSVLMFAPVQGRPTLVGAAYAYMHPVGAAPPQGFDGAGDVWHAHERLAQLPGEHLLMMHVWFVGAPDGPFARYNPWLPYLEAGLTPPSAAELADPRTGERARRLGLALAVAATPPLLLEWLEQEGGDALRRRAARHRGAIVALVPRLAAAERSGDVSARARLAAEAIVHGDSLAAAYRGALPGRPHVRRLVNRTVDEFMGRGHGIEEELGALLRGGSAAGPGAHRH